MTMTMKMFTSNHPLSQIYSAITIIMYQLRRLWGNSVPILSTRTTQRRRKHHILVPHLFMALSCCHSTTTQGLNIALLTGSTRTSSPPTVLHPRVNTYIHKSLTQRGHEVTRIDPDNFPLLEKPHFAYPTGKSPSNLQEIHSILQDADGYVCVTPEYNHSPSPALLNILNHFGSSTFAFKPSAIGQWGGTRAGVALRTTLSELGCLPVSAMIHIPKAQEVFDRDGNINTSKDGNDPEQWQKYCGRCFSQLEWWAEAARRHREVADPFNESPVFEKSPDQRNAP